jgi:hypothetical protein
MGAVISPRDANLGVEDTENVTQVVIKNVVWIEQDAIVES